MDPFPGLPSEYAPLRLRGEAWGALSILLAITALFARVLVRLVGAGLPWSRRAWLSAVAPSVLSLVGLLLGLVGRWVAGRRLLVRAGIWANLVILALSALFLVAFYLILPPEWRSLPWQRR